MLPFWKVSDGHIDGPVSLCLLRHWVLSFCKSLAHVESRKTIILTCHITIAVCKAECVLHGILAIWVSFLTE